MKRDETNGLSRREFLAATKQYGLKTALFAAATANIAGVVPSLSEYLIRDARAKESAKYKLRFAVSVYSTETERYLPTGQFEFAQHLERLTDGEVHLDIIESARACAESTCGTRVAQGVLDIGTSAPHNLAGVMRYSLAPHWPFLWNNGTEYQNFVLSQKFDHLYRDVMRRAYGVEVLFGGSEMRNLYAGLQYSDAPDIDSPEQLRGSKVRITNSPMIQSFIASLGMNPIPLSWTELLEGLKSGIVDNTETYPGAIAAFGMAGVISQEIQIDFTPGGQIIFMNLKAFEKLPGRIKDTIYEAARLAMLDRHANMPEGEKATRSLFDREGVRPVKIEGEKMAAFNDVGSVENNPDLYASLRKELNSIAGFDVYEEMKAAQSEFAGKQLIQS